MSKLAWSCDERDRKNCRNAHGCHCREITELLRKRDNISKLNHARAKLVDALRDPISAMAPASCGSVSITRKRRHEAMLEQGMHAGNTDAKFDPPPAPFDTVTKCKQWPNGRCLTEAACNSVRRCYYAIPPANRDTAT